MKIRLAQLIFLIATYTPLVLLAQDNTAYRLFDIQRKTGVVDTSGKEVIAPQYSGVVEHIYAKSQWVFHDTNKKGLLFNRNTGQMKEYDDIDVRHLEYRDTFYTRIKDDNSYYLLSEVNDMKIKLPKGWEDVGAVGDFFVFEEYYSAPSTSSKKDKNGRWLPPEVSKTQRQYKLYRNIGDAKPVQSVIADKYLLLDEKKENDWTTISKGGWTASFDYILFINGTLITVYDKDLKLVKKLTSKVTGDYELKDAVAIAINKKLELANEVHVMGFNDIKYPALKEQQRNGYYILNIQKDAYNDKMIPLLRSEYEITARGDMAHIVQGNEYIASFEADPITGKIFLPEKYFSELKLEKINVTSAQK